MVIPAAPLAPKSASSCALELEPAKAGTLTLDLWPSPKPEVDPPAPLPLPPAPSYETIKIVATRSEDIAAVRASAAHLQLTWALYQELGRPGHLVEAVERQLDSLARSVNRLSGLPTSSIAVPIPEESPRELAQARESAGRVPDKPPCL